MFQTQAVLQRRGWDANANSWRYLSGGGFPSEELVVQGAVRWAELGLEEDAAVCDGLQRSRAFVWKTEADEELEAEQHS